MSARLVPAAQLDRALMRLSPDVIPAETTMFQHLENHASHVGPTPPQIRAKPTVSNHSGVRQACSANMERGSAVTSMNASSVHLAISVRASALNAHRARKGQGRAPIKTTQHAYNVQLAKLPPMTWTSALPVLAQTILATACSVWNVFGHG